LPSRPWCLLVLISITDQNTRRVRLTTAVPRAAQQQPCTSHRPARGPDPVAVAAAAAAAAAGASGRWRTACRAPGEEKGNPHVDVGPAAVAAADTHTRCIRSAACTRPNTAMINTTSSKSTECRLTRGTLSTGIRGRPWRREFESCSQVNCERIGHTEHRAQPCSTHRIVHGGYRSDSGPAIGAVRHRRQHHAMPVAIRVHGGHSKADGHRHVL